MSPRPRRLQDEAPETGTVAGLTHEGDGIVRCGKAVFVAGALPGETIRFRRVRRHRQHDEGELLEVLEASAHRVAPRCAHFGVCGGCALQHLAADEQLAMKQTALRDNLERVARVTPREWLAPLTGSAWAYRRRARLGAKFVIKKDRVVVGFRERLAPYVAAVEQCEVLAAPVGALIAPLAAMLTQLSIRQRMPQIEVAIGDNAVALVLRVLEPVSPADRTVLREFADRHGIRFYLQPGGLESVRELNEEGGGGEPLYYRLGRYDLRLEFLPTDFVQVNGPVNEALIARALELLAPTGESRVLDLFCGLGNFTLPLARVAGAVTGIEGEPSLIDRARHNARLNGLANTEFHVANLARPFDAATAWAARPYSHVLLDPPRAGAREVLADVARLQPRRVLYISCHPGSLARDLGVLVHEHGFDLRAAGVVDMFPHTAHVESLAVLEPGGRQRS
ncbi:MAG TPA: 23S rRNA (uracil(1939)-C(5))-methyltransferase RlmD [Steroidobacteraceae bacterium]|nr:23S rRNA (uracil(1939)-C(5))-methyltransferase RlmD [Steroidobacteraceae bacterium]